jgi:spore germination protein
MKHGKLACVLVLTLFLNGCWDKVEIDRRIFVSTIGIDVGKDIEKEEVLKDIQPDEPFGERIIEKINVTYAFPNISEYNIEQGQIPEDNTINVEAYSLEDAIIRATVKSSRNVYMDHTKLLVLSEELLAFPDTVKEVIDYLSRHPKINRMLKVVVMEGRSEDLIAYDTVLETNISTYLRGLMENSSRNSSILPVSLNEFLKLLSENGNAIVPSMKIDRDKNELKLSGVAIIKDYKLEGYLSPAETSSLLMLRGRLRGGKKVIFVDGIPVDYEIDEVRRRIRLDNSGENLVFNVDVIMEGRLRGYHIDKEIFDKEMLSELQQNFNRSIRLEAEKIIELTQSEFGVDPIGFREYLEKFRPGVWDRVKDNWEEAYQAAVVNVNVDMNIRRIGVKK